MKQVMVIRLFMDSQQVSLPRKLFNMRGKKMSDQRMRARILQIVASVIGVDKAEFKGSDKRLVEVGGDGFDLVELITKLRRSACRAEIQSVAEVKEEAKKQAGEAEKKPTEAATAMTLLPMHWPHYYMTVY